jgi:hypothetical protein
MTSYVNTFIDTVQGAKTNFVNTFVTNEELKKPLQSYIDAQSAFAKKVVGSATEFFTTVGTAAYSFDAKKAFGTK